MKKLFYLSILFIGLASCPTSNVNAQGVGVNSSGNPPDPSAIFDASANDKGMLIPRLTTTQRTTIATPATGLLVYDTDTNSFWYYNGTTWTEIGGANAGDITDVTAGNGLTGGTTTGNATLDVGAGAGITVNANDVSLSPSGVTAGSYTSSNITVDAYGRVTSAANGSSGGSGIKDLAYPDGFTNWTPVSVTVTNTTPYNVPSGKNLYVTTFSRVSDSYNFGVDDVGIMNYNYESRTSLPVIAKTNARCFGNPCSAGFNGFLVDATVTPVSLEVNSSTSYTVPSGKTLVILQILMTIEDIFYVNGVRVFKGRSNFGATSYYQLNIPIIASSGSVLSTNGAYINGYLMNN